MKVVAFITEVAVVDRIIDHLKLTFVTAKLPHVLITAINKEQKMSDEVDDVNSSYRFRIILK